MVTIDQPGWIEMWIGPIWTRPCGCGHRINGRTDLRGVAASTEVFNDVPNDFGLRIELTMLSVSAPLFLVDNVERRALEMQQFEG